MAPLSTYTDPQRFRSAREAAGLSLADIAAAEGTTESAIRRFEEEIVKIRVRRLNRFAKLLQTEAAELRGKPPKAAKPVKLLGWARQAALEAQAAGIEEATSTAPESPPQTTILTVFDEVVCDGYSFRVRPASHPRLPTIITRHFKAMLGTGGELEGQLRWPYTYPSSGPYDGFISWDVLWLKTVGPKLLHAAIADEVAGRFSVESYEEFLAPFLRAEEQPDPAALAQGVEIGIYPDVRGHSVWVQGDFHGATKPTLKHTFGPRASYKNALRGWEVKATGQEVYKALTDALPCPPGEVFIATGVYLVEFGHLVETKPADIKVEPLPQGANIITSSVLGKLIKTTAEDLHELLYSLGYLTRKREFPYYDLTPKAKDIGAIWSVRGYTPCFMWPEDLAENLHEISAMAKHHRKLVAQEERAQRKIDEQREAAEQKRLDTFDATFLDSMEKGPHWLFAAKLIATCRAKKIRGSALGIPNEDKLSILSGQTMPDEGTGRRMLSGLGERISGITGKRVVAALRNAVADYGPPWPAAPEPTPEGVLFGIKLKATREALGISPERLYKLDEQQRFEGGREYPSPHQCRNLCKMFGIPGKCFDFDALQKLKRAVSPHGPRWLEEPPDPEEYALTGPPRPTPYANMGEKLRKIREHTGETPESVYRGRNPERFERGYVAPDREVAVRLYHRYTERHLATKDETVALAALQTLLAPYGPDEDPAQAFVGPVIPPYWRFGHKMRAFREAFQFSIPEFYSTGHHRDSSHVIGLRIETGWQLPGDWTRSRIVQKTRETHGSWEASLKNMCKVIAPYGPPWDGQEPTKDDPLLEPCSDDI